MFLINHSLVVNKIYQSMQATVDIFVSSVIYGEEFNGKRSLVKKVFKDAVWVDGSDLSEVIGALKDNRYVVINNFQKISDLDSLDFENKNVVAIYNGNILPKRVEDKFAFIYYIPPLKNRLDEVELLTKHYIQEAKESFEIEEDIKVDTKDIDLSKNLKSLKSSIYKAILFNNISEDELSYLLYNYFIKNYEGVDVYKRMLSIFEKELVRAGLDIYKSQLKLSDILGINRNTLRKKVNEYLWYWL